MALRPSHLTAAGLGAMTDAIRIARDQLAPSTVSGFARRNDGFGEALSRNGADSGPAGPARALAPHEGVHPRTPDQGTGATELAIQGDGYLAVSGEVAGTPGTFFVQRGQFRTNVNGSIVTAGNLTLLGRPMLPDGSLASNVAPLAVSLGALPARHSTELTIAANLDASAGAVGASPTEAVGLNAVAEVFDQLGRPQAIRLQFSKLAEGEWQYRALVDAHQLEQAAAVGEVVVGEGSLHFSGEGLLEDYTPRQPLDVAFRGVGAVQHIELGLGDAIAQGGTGLSGTTQFSMPSGVARISQDGHAAGTASGFEVLPDGIVDVSFSNGQRRPVGQVVVAQFRNDQLAAASEGVFTQTQESGQAVLGGPGRNGRGTVSSSREFDSRDSSDEPVVNLRPQRIVSTNAQVMAAASDMLSMLLTSTMQR